MFVQIFSRVVDATCQLPGPHFDTSRRSTPIVLRAPPMFVQPSSNLYYDCTRIERYCSTCQRILFLFVLLFVNVTVICLLSAKGNVWSVHGYLFVQFSKGVFQYNLKIKEFPFDFTTDVNCTF